MPTSNFRRQSYRRTFRFPSNTGLLRDRRLTCSIFGSSSSDRPKALGALHRIWVLSLLGKVHQNFSYQKTTNDQPVFVFASTNRIDLIDPAILERFTDRIEIPLPGLDERIQLLKLFIKIPFDNPKRTIISPDPPESMAIVRLALATDGKSGRELKNIVTRATMVAVRRSYQGGIRKPVTFRESDFEPLNVG